MDVKTGILSPMLGLEIPHQPRIIRDTSLPESLLGFYASGENVIRLRPMEMRRTVAVLAHELAHAWELQGGFSDKLVDPTWLASRKLFLEGFAQWVETKALDYFGFGFEVSQISGWPPDEYGIGFRLFASLEEDKRHGGIAGVLRFVADPKADPYPAWLQSFFESAAYQAEISQVQAIMDTRGLESDWHMPNEAPATPSPVDPADGSMEASAKTETAAEHPDAPSKDENGYAGGAEADAQYQGPPEAAHPEVANGDEPVESTVSGDGTVGPSGDGTQADLSGVHGTKRSRRKSKRRR